MGRGISRARWTTRGDLTEYLNESTPFPDRVIAETSYTLHPDYRRLLDRILD